GCGCGGATSKPIKLRQQDGQYLHFSYDWAGRLDKKWYSANSSLTTSEQSNPQLIFAYDKSSRLISVTDSRLTLANPASGTPKTYTYAYDSGSGATGRLVSISHPEGYKQEFVYQDDDQSDHYRKLIGYKDVDGNLVSYEYDSLERLAAVGEA